MKSFVKALSFVKTLSFIKVLSFSSIVLISGCSWFGDDERDFGPTLAELKPASLPAVTSDLPTVELDEVVLQYRKVLEVTQDPETARKVMSRLAGLEMIRSEEQQLNATEMRRFFDEAITLYRDLLAQQPDAAENDRLLYQVAKAQQMDGRSQDSMKELDQLVSRHADSEFYAEAQFRRGEILFSQQQYREAERAYAEVLKSGQASPFYSNALYMQGWSRFKQARYRTALKPFTDVLDLLLEGRETLDGLTRPQQELANDALRVMSLAFSYLEGANTIASTYQQLGPRPYEHLFYQNLGQLYLDKKRFRDSAETFQAFVERYPLSDYAPGFNVKTIEVYGKGNFPTLVLPAKQQFVTNYGIHSQYWQGKDEAVRDTLRPHLHRYLMELAQHHHATAQGLQKELAKQQSQKQSPEQQSNKPAKPAIKPQQVAAAFLQAGDWYSQFVETFPDDKATPGVVYLMAETLYEAGEMPRAINAYEQVAYQYKSPKKGADAGYSAILAYDRHLQNLTAAKKPDAEKLVWQRNKIASAQQFADAYKNDKRAVPVLTKAAENLLELNEFGQAIEVASQLTEWQPAPKASFLYTAWLVQGHSHFELEDYIAAEQSYRGALKSAKQMPRKEQDTEQQSKVVERIAASIYKQGEQYLAIDEKQLAVDEYLRVQEIAPDSEIAISAQYDAATYLMEMNNWQQAETVLVSFRNRYAKHKLAVGISAKLAETWQQLEKWDRAAAEVSAIAKNNADPEARRQSLYLAAELYEKAGDFQRAIEQYRDYAHTYPEPFALVTEARYKLSELYVRTKEPGKRQFWLRKLIDGHRDAKGKGTDRSRYLAAFSADVFADIEYRKYSAIPLKLPLKTSLKKKRAALDKSLKAYQGVLDYEVAEFATRANFHIGEMYVVLSRDLMDSQRPKLNALELEQYEILLEEQAYPFEEKAIEIHEANIARLGEGLYDNWVEKSITSLAKLLPARYAKREQLEDFSRDIF